MKKLRNWLSKDISIALILVALLTLYVALFVRNPWVKGALLFWEVAP